MSEAGTPRLDGILVATDAGRPKVVVALRRDGAAASVDDDAVALARRLGGTVVAVGVVRPDASSSAHARTSWDARFEHAVAAGRHLGVTVDTELVTASDSAQAIALVAGRHEASVILLQRRGRGRLDRVRARRLRHRLRKLSQALVFTVGGR